MNILVCIKQVPGTSKVEVDPGTGVLKRDGVDSKMNPYDLYALETALRIRESKGGTVKVLSMGPSQAAQESRGLGDVYKRQISSFKHNKRSICYGSG